MLKKENIKMILESVRIDWDKCDEKDIAFAILCDALEDKTLAYRLAYRKSEKDAAKFYDTQVEGGKKEKPPVVVTLASKDDYLAYKKS